MLLSDLQAMLSGIYDVPLVYDVADFVFTERQRLPRELRARAGDEQVLVTMDGADAAIGVYIDAGVLARLGSDDPLRAVNSRNLADLLTVTEGVSHFVYLAWNAGYDRAVSLLELELQAEVDKYVSILALLRAQDPARFPRELHWLLFERARVDETLAGERAGLYRRAHCFASRYCRRIESRLACLRNTLEHDLRAELRRFYRFGSAGKFRHIERWA